ncbi:MAG TPA: zinc ribbon domain-containing protein [Mucilaginibacter sp.]|nr:zinc ribbon domain-containing protein [Mucilaginibacter sp.]
MELTTTPSNETHLCDSCFSPVGADDQFCPHCGYPLKGTPEEQKTFKSKQIVNSIDMADYQKKLRIAANTLYYLCGIFILAAIVLFFVHKDEDQVLAYVIPNLILAVIFLLLGAFTKKQPLACVISGLCLYVIVQVLNAMVDIKTLFSGIYIKIFIILFLIRGIKSAIEVDRIRKESNLV